MEFLKKIRSRPAILFPLILIIVEVVLFLTNYRPGTYLIGWDNIMPEFDIKLNLSRSFFSIWQEYRGLGVLDGLAHAANLMHTIYIAILSIFFPDSMLRYLYTHLTHLVGGISFFFLLRKLTKNDIAAFIGSLFYMFNLGVIQMYFAPLEVFTTHFAALPLLALLVTNALEKANLKNLIFLFLGCILMSPQGFVPTVFIAFSILIFFILLIDLIKTRGLKKIILVGLVIFCANAFWLIPYSFSAVQTGGDIKNSRINQFSSEEIFYRNKSFGDIESVAGLKGFMIDAVELDPTTFQNAYFMQGWKILSESPFYLPLYLIFFIIMGIGIIQIIRHTKSQFFPYFLTIIITFIFLANSTPIAAQINLFIRNTYPLVGEAFRFPFTKFITLFAFCFSVLLTYGIVNILNKSPRFRKMIIVGLIVTIFTMSLPAFFGFFTSPYLRNKVPQEYLSLFSDMQKKNPQERVVLFPVQTFWNWQYRNWGQRGSGFSWYGMPQPILERAFDPWSPYDEQFYNEISYAVNTQDSDLFKQVINKYDISYIVLDETILNTLSPKEINYDSLKKFLEAQENVTLEKDYGNLVLYKTGRDNGWIYSLNADTTKEIYPNYSFEREDSIYKFTDNYITDSKKPSVVNLFPSLFSEKLQEDLEFNIKNNQNSYTLTPKNKLPENLSNYILRIPSMFETEFLVPVRIKFEEGNLILTPKYPKITINGAQLAIEEDPIIIKPQEVTNPVSVEFIETKQKVALDEDATAYLINPAFNSIKFEDARGNTEVVYFDTSTLDKNAFFANLPKEKIDSVAVEIEKTASPTQSINNVIKDKKYKINKKISKLFANPYSQTEVKQGAGFVDLAAIDGHSELTFYMPDLYHQASYILFADTQYKSGLPMRFYLDNDTERRAEVETVFSKNVDETTIVIPKSNNFFRGYGFHFTVRSVGKEYAQSILKSVELYPLPDGLIRGLQFIDQSTYQKSINENPKTTIANNRINTALYTTSKSKPNSFLVLSQAYDIGWQAYETNNLNWLSVHFPFIFGNKLEGHVLENNWANAWRTEKGGNTVMIFIPSYFQYLGQFVTSTVILILLILGLHRYHHRHKKRHHV